MSKVFGTGEIASNERLPGLSLIVQRDRNSSWNILFAFITFDLMLQEAFG